VVERLEVLPVRGEDTEVLAKVAVCPNCGADMSVEELDDVTLIAAFNLYRQHHGLMSPEEMRSLRGRYGLGVRPFALLLGWGEITLHRYESGSLQDSAHEATLRLAEDPGNIRILLSANGHKLTARQRARVEAHLAALERGAAAAKAEDLKDVFMAREEQDAYSGWVPMQLSKLREMILYFAALPDMYETKLNKLLFYADFSHFKHFSVSISGSPYLAFPHGPILQHYPRVEADLLECGELLVDERFFADGGSGTVFSAERVADLSVFSADEQATLQRIAEHLGDKTSRQLRDMSHAESAWRDTPERAMIDYSKAADLSL
jgi:putative zinc finger/helix-turn-helix YgiT family protein